MTKVPARTVVTILEIEPDGCAQAYHYHPGQGLIELLMMMLGAPDRVMAMTSGAIERIGGAAHRETSGPGVETWSANDDHMPEAMWPDEQDDLADDAWQHEEPPPLSRGVKADTRTPRHT